MKVIPALAAIVVLRTLARCASILPSMRFTSVELPRLTARLLFPRWLQSDAGLTRGLQSSVSKHGAGTHGALISEDFRARLHAQRPAMAASGASRSTQ